MKTHALHLVCLMVLASLSAGPLFAVAPEIPNGGFESWNEINYAFPTGYNFHSNLFKALSGEPSNVNRISDSKHGSYAVRLHTDSLPSEMNFGFIVLANVNEGESESWTGGIPLDQPATGISGWYKYDYVKSDSALVLVVLRNKGELLGEYYFFLKERKTEWTRFEFDFAPASPGQPLPDSIIIGFASSGDTDKGGANPGSTLYLDSISLKGCTIQPAALNGDFENWESKSLATPSAWHIAQETEGENWRTSDCKEGNYAIQLSTLKSQYGNVYKEIAQHMVLGTLVGDSIREWEDAIKLRPYMVDTLTFWYKYVTQVNKSYAGLQMMYMVNNMPVWHEFVKLTPCSTYREMKVPLHRESVMYGRGGLTLVFTSTVEIDSIGSHIGSTLYLDKLAMLEGDSVFKQVVTVTSLTNGSFEQWNSRLLEYPETYEFNSNIYRTRDPLAPFNLTRSPSAQHGSFALRMESDDWSESPNFGFIMTKEQDGDPTSWHGGIPITERPTGLRGFYMYKPAETDTALMFIAFSKSGINIGSYAHALKRTTPDLPISSNYTPFEMTFSPALTETPDSVTIGFATGSNTNSNQDPGNILLLDNLSLTGVTQQPAQWNGDFERWVSLSLETPVGWTVNNNSPLNTNKSTHAADGNFAIEVRTSLNQDGLGVFSCEPGWICNGYWDGESKSWHGGSPIKSGAPDTLSFWYDYTSPSGDSAQVMLMYKYQGELSAGQNIWLYPTKGYENRAIPCDGMYPHIMPLGLELPFLKDSVLIIFASGTWGGAAGNEGSVLRIDDVRFKSSGKANALHSTKASDEILYGPNPTHGPVYLQFSGECPDRIEVYDLSGRCVLRLNENEIAPTTRLELSGNVPGVYLVRVIGKSTTQRLKVLLR